MEYYCPICGNKLATEDENIYTCIKCDQTFVIDELKEEFGLETTEVM